MEALHLSRYAIDYRPRARFMLLPQSTRFNGAQLAAENHLGQISGVSQLSFVDCSIVFASRREACNIQVTQTLTLLRPAKESGEAAVTTHLSCMAETNLTNVKLRPYPRCTSCVGCRPDEDPHKA